ncbi:hypothetical protein DKP85_06005 [Bacillus thuringiensis]|nr:hypothetical protein [Bacillus toyonensis biovar Thuringiensis]
MKGTRKWTFLYLAIDSQEKTIDFLLSKTRKLYNLFMFSPPCHNRR